MRRVLPFLFVLLGTTACGGGPDGDVELAVLADSSLSDAMTEISDAYAQSHPGVTLEVTVGGSQELSAQVRKGRPGADVIAVADTRTLDDIGKYVEGRTVIARNYLTIAVAPGNPRRVRGLSSLAGRRLRVVLGTDAGPIGRDSLLALRKAGVTVKPSSEEIDVRSVLGRVRNGEADAGLVYITDMKSAGAAASSVAIPAAQNVTAVYPAATVRKSEHRKEAAAFVTWLASPEGTALLRKYGLQSP
ncbi:molybdate ABC transporter substrate-binding protein [Actinocorallia longicatena]|uniref:Molybdate ABC transporter substrate-binding protein n=1 Tax=Actinocorallia longicatena TaxID=111803 RepID=A0ABP6QLS5_9ACTN